MSDGDGLFDRLRARLAPTQDDSASPQARDERPTVVGREEYREEVDEQQIETFVREYYRNPLVRVPVQNFASDVTEPGVSVDVVPRDDDGDIPTVEYDGRDRPLDEALSAWASSCFIDGFRFDGDFADLLEEAVKDRRGRRGTSIVEHAYDDPRERERLLGLKPLKTETVTAYTREGKAIVLRPDDDPGSFDTVAVRDYGDAVRDEAPMTPAGKTAAIAQFDDVFGAEEREEIPFALDDVTVSPHDADTGELFGRPDSSPVIERARSLRKKLRYVDQSVVNTAFGNIIATVETQDAEVVKNVRDNLDVNVKDRGEDVDPETVSATNAAVDVTEVEGQVPDVVDIIQQEIEYVLSAMPTPLYRVGFAGDINRDVTSEQGQDYRDAVKRERRRLEADFTDILERKARELLYGDAHADEALDVDVSLRIRPEASESPLRDEEFDAGEFGELMSALSTAAGPKGGATEIIPEDVIIETLLDMDAEAMQEAAPGDDDAPLTVPPTEFSDAELEAFDEFTDATLANRYREGDIVETPEGLGVVTAVETAPFTGKNDEEIDASEDSPTYVVGLKDQQVGVGFYSASELDSAEMPDPGVEDPVNALTEQAGATDSGAALAETTFDIPESWEESPKPNRLILLDAWSSMGGTFEGARRELGSKRLAASMKDRVLQWEGWREGG